jgi:hypothetical protein
VEGAIRVADGPSRIRLESGGLWVTAANAVSRIVLPDRTVTNIPIDGNVVAAAASHLQDPAAAKPLYVLVA